MTKNQKAPAIIITILVFLGLFLGNYGQFQLAAVPSRIYETYRLNDIQFSTVMTSPMVPAIFFSIVLGVLSDRFGIKKVAAICTGLSVLGYGLRWAFPSYGMLYTGMFLTGFVATVFNTNAAKIAASLYPPEKVGAVVGIFMAGSTGAMAVAYGTTALFPTLNSEFLFPVIASVLHLMLWLVCVRHKDLGEVASAGAEDKGALIQALKISLKSKNVWLMGFGLLTLMGGVMVISNFQVVYLTSVKGYTEAAAGTFGTVLMVGAILGSLFLPMYLPKCRNIPVFLLALGLISGAATSFPVRFPEIGPRYAGTASGVACTLQLLGAVVIPTYIVLPLAGENMAQCFTLAAVIFAISGITNFIIAKKLNF